MTDHTYHQTMTWREAYDKFDNELNESYGAIDVAGLLYEPARILLLVDPVAYRCTFNDWADAIDIDVDALMGIADRH